MADILIKNGTVIAIDPERRIIADGASENGTSARE